MSTYQHIIILFLSMSFTTTNIFNFTAETKASEWQIVNDGVMGGKSSSTLQVSEEGYGIFKGHISLANNGGFASVRHNPNFKGVKNYKQIVLKVKGDGKKYQFRLKASSQQRQSYVQEFNTDGEWQEIKLNIDDFSPQFRGRKLEMLNFNFDELAEIAFLIGNKKEQDFKLIIDHISIQ